MKKSTMAFERIPEPELMDSPAQTEAYASADFSSTNQDFVDHLLQHYQAEASGLLYDLGCGPADITIRLAKALPGWQLVGLDGGKNMLAAGQQACQQAQLAQQIQFRLSLLPDPELPEHQADAAVSNSLLHHLPAPDSLWASIRQLLKPGGYFQVMDLARPESQDAARDLVAQHAADASSVLKEDFYNSLLAAYTPEEVRAQLQQAGIKQYQLATPTDRHWIIWGRLD